MDHVALKLLPVFEEEETYTEALSSYFDDRKWAVYATGGVEDAKIPDTLVGTFSFKCLPSLTPVFIPASLLP